MRVFSVAVHDVAWLPLQKSSDIAHPEQPCNLVRPLCRELLQRAYNHCPCEDIHGYVF
jgi:hypothetical protein